jgi:ArsR family transcriptional regulator
MSGAPPAAEAACDAQAGAELLRALAHPMRLQILCRLLQGELAVGGFESELGLRQPNLSQQLGQLREAGLVTTRRVAKAVFYRLADKRVRIILDALRQALGLPQPQPAGRMPVGQMPAGRIPVGQMPAGGMPSGGQAIVTGPIVASSAAVVPAERPAPAGAECGVFSVAGWPAAPDGRIRTGV